MLASDWSRGRGWFLTPVGMYNDVQVVNRMYIYIRNQDQSLIWSEKVVLKKNSDPPPPLQCSGVVPRLVARTQCFCAYSKINFQDLVA